MAKTIAELIENRFGLPTETGREMPAGGPLAQILERRTHRRYTDRPITPDLLEILFSCAFSASAKSDLQQASVCVIDDPVERKEIADLIPAMPWIGTAPVFMIWLGDGRRIRRICEDRGKPFANDHLDAFFNPTVDAALAMQTFILAAESVGLGCCPISVVRNHSFRIGEILCLPKWVFPVAGLCVGYPSQEGFISLRVPPAVTVHVNRYDDGRLPDGIDSYDRRRDARFSIPEAAQRLVDRYGKADFYGWSEDKARQVSETEREDFGAFVRKQGFKLE